MKVVVLLAAAAGLVPWGTPAQAQTAPSEAPAPARPADTAVPTPPPAEPAPPSAAMPAAPVAPPTQAPLATTAPAVPPPAPSPAQPGATPATVLDAQNFEGLLGRNVRNTTGEDMGRIIDIIIDREGRMRAAIIDFGGFLGVGSRKIAVDWRALQFPPDGKPARVVLQLTRNQVRVSPEYKSGEPIVVLGPASPDVEVAARPAPEK